MQSLKYRLIVLITSAKVFGIEEQMKEITNKYMVLYPGKIKHFYIEYIPDLEVDIKEEGNYLYIKGTENRYYMYHKTIRAMEYINNHYNYDFLLRTTLGTFHVLDNTLQYLNTLPLHNFTGGFFMFNQFISGTAIFLSKDSTHRIVEEGKREIAWANFDYFSHDDVSISNTIRRCNIPIYPIGDNYIMTYITELDNNEITPEQPFNPNITYPPNTLYFRIKYQPDRNIDILYNKLFLKKIYGIDM